MNDSELMQEVKALKSRIKELEKELENVGNEGEEKYPAEGTTIYFLNAFGSVTWDSWGGWIREDSPKCMKQLFDGGEVFLTEKDAEEYAEVKQIERELFVLADGAEEWDGKTDHYALQYAFYSDTIYCTTWTTSKMNIPYFKSKESAMAAIEKVGKERVVKWLTYKRVRGNYK